MISVLIPTRKRREGLLRAIESCRATETYPTEIVAYVDEDDAQSYADINLPNVQFIIGPRIILSNCWNKCATAAKGDILMQGNDDIVFRTQSWDVMVEHAFERCADRILMVHGSDGSQGHNSSIGLFGPHPFVHRNWVDALDYFTAPYFSSDYGDSWINDLANGIGRRQFIPFVIEHLHFIFGKAAQDETTNERLMRHSADNVSQLYQDLAPLRALDIEKLQAAMR